MLRNIPNNYSRDMVLELLDDHGFAGQDELVRFGMQGSDVYSS